MPDICVHCQPFKTRTIVEELVTPLTDEDKIVLGVLNAALSVTDEP